MPDRTPTRAEEVEKIRAKIPRYLTASSRLAEVARDDLQPLLARLDVVERERDDRDGLLRAVRRELWACIHNGDQEFLGSRSGYPAIDRLLGEEWS